MNQTELNNFKDLFAKINAVQSVKNLSWEKSKDVILECAQLLGKQKSGILKTPFLPDYKYREVLNIIREFITVNYSAEPGYFYGGIFLNALLNFHKDDSRDIQYDNSEKKENGIFFTPLKTAEAFISDLFSYYSEDIVAEEKNPQVLDLASGYGIFSILLTIQSGEKSSPFYRTPVNPDLEKYFSRPLKESTVSRLNFITSILTAIDKNPHAVSICRKGLLLAALKDEKEIISDDDFETLAKSLKNIMVSDIIETYSLSQQAPGKKYHLIVSNPPYLSYYSRQSRGRVFKDDIFEQMKRNLAFQDSRSLSGRINSVMFFIDYAVKNALPEGVIALLIDLNIHENLFLKTRKWLHEKTTLLQSSVNIQDFPGVNSGQSFLYFKNSPGRNHETALLKDQENQDVRIVSLGTLKEGGSFYIRSHSSWIESLCENPRLNEIARINTGINIGGSSEEFLYDSNINSSCYPMVSVGQIKNKYHLESSGKLQYVDYNFEKAETINRNNKNKDSRNIVVLGRLERFLNPKIFIRQSAPEIIAVLSEDKMVCPYSVFVLNSTSEISLYTILGILNSRMISRFARETGIIRTGAGKQPQIRKKGLDAIPVPRREYLVKYSEELDVLVKNLLKNYRNFSQADLTKTERDIENTVSLMFNVKPELYN